MGTYQSSQYDRSAKDRFRYQIDKDRLKPWKVG